MLTADIDGLAQHALGSLRHGRSSGSIMACSMIPGRAGTTFVYQIGRPMRQRIFTPGESGAARIFCAASFGGDVAVAGRRQACCAFAIHFVESCGSVEQDGEHIGALDECAARHYRASRPEDCCEITSINTAPD